MHTICQSFLTSLLILIIFAHQNNSEMTEDTLNYRAEMVTFVQELQQKANERSPGFTVIAQNGERLLTQTGNPGDPPNISYLQAIDGIARESLFYGYNEDNVKTPLNVQDWIMSFLDVAKTHGKQVMAVNYCSTHKKVVDSYQLSDQHGYIAFAAPERELTVIPDHPADIIHQNDRNIQSLSEASNFLYLLNPEQFTSKKDFLKALHQTNYDALVIDWVFSKGLPLTPGEVKSLKIKANGGQRLVFSYLSIGEAEDYRYYWQPEWSQNRPEWILPENPDWPGNYPVKYWEEEWKTIMYNGEDSYLSRIVDAGYDGVYLDRIDAFEYFQDQPKETDSK